MALSQINFEFDDEISSPAERNRKSVEDAIKPKSGRGRKSIKEFSASAGELSVPEDAVLFQKQYYAIGDVAEMFNENISLIRYWSNEFTILKPKKNKKGDRFFRPEDIKNLKIIYHLLRERKYTLAGAREFLKNNKIAGEKQELIESLEKVKSFLLELKVNL